jgi:hemoglobin
MAQAPPIPVPNPWGESATPYIELGGDEAVRGLSETFYATIDAESPPLRAMLPNRLDGSIEKFYEYLSGWLGGPQLYAAKRGHPRLRMRHLPFPIGSFEVEEWLRCMALALDARRVGGPLRLFLDERFATVAHHMRNQ